MKQKFNITLFLDIDELSLICTSLDYCIRFSDCSEKHREELINLLKEIND